VKRFIAVLAYAYLEHPSNTEITYKSLETWAAYMDMNTMLASIRFLARKSLYDVILEVAK